MATEKYGNDMATTIVIGAGQAGAEVVSKLRDEGHEDRIVLIGQEDYLPYQRPPLSKKIYGRRNGFGKVISST